MVRSKDLHVVVRNGQIDSTYKDAYSANERLEQIESSNRAYAQSEYGLDSDSRSYFEDLNYISGYEGDSAYVWNVEVDKKDLDRYYETPEGDEFSGGEILSW